jgi:hypothetical protein
MNPINYMIVIDRVLLSIKNALLTLKSRSKSPASIDEESDVC